MTKVRSALRARLLLASSLALVLSVPEALAQPEIPDAAPARGKRGKRKPDAKSDAKPEPRSDAKPDAKADAPAEASAGKVDAKALVQSGVKLLKQKDYLGALAVFRDAYQRFPSVKLLLNIGTTLKLLGRNAEAANAYQRYLDDPEADPARVSEVGDVLATLDRVLGRVQLGVAASTPDDTEISINGGEWLPLSQAKLLRVDPGAYQLAARRDGFAPVELSGNVAAGELVEAQLQLIALPPEPAAAGGAGQGEPLAAAGALSVRRSASESRRSRLGLMLRGHFHISPAGAAALVGPSVDLTDRIEVNAAALIGRFRGGYLGGSYAVLPGRYRPIASAGLLVVSDEGARFAARAAVGLEVFVNRNVSLFAELGGEHLFNPPMTVYSNAFVPSAGVFGRL
jgi:hypothetical protein